MRALLLLPCLTLTACASLSGGRDHSFVCSYDTAWDATLDTMKDYAITSENKNAGTIETTWVEMDGKKRPYGIFGREGFGNRERARLTVIVKNDNGRALVNILETRQRWHAKGGATQQAIKWWPVEPSEEVMEEITNKLNTRITEKGCKVNP
ncbi:MAG: hypothetical protein KF751_07500 [Nitrospira sp.]|nr:hypothetical protein [Nitrospira sp.]MBX3347360.1 hypothetical protein [Nitrospira sp.]